MSNFLSPAAAYLNRRNELLAERSVVQSPAVIQTINKALLASEIAMATFHDLEALKTLQQRKARLIEWHEPESLQELQSFELASNKLAFADETDEQVYLHYHQEFTRLAASFSWQHASLEMVQNDLFSTTFNLWLETLEELFSTPGRKQLFIRIEKILAFSIGKIPLLGDAIDVYRMLASVMTSCQEKARSSDDYFQTLESYTEAANLCSKAILIFCFTTEAILRGRELPGEALLSEKIKGHYSSVIDGTHPYF
ncbi:hypothetical protein Q3V30_13275 [Erwinia pyri]|uniref:Uncharacterized protein n=1 Tax=Erwinia pyri TaxID=3062598 RepID=A0AA50HP23_9GAMM|nr:hypothetical protein [Erwinia sp. DE2]WLS77453.1 hypothetical protein Q3V30_13275 [Erwinia sp. DE2]